MRCEHCGSRDIYTDDEPPAIDSEMVKEALTTTRAAKVRMMGVLDPDDLLNIKRWIERTEIKLVAALSGVTCAEFHETDPERDPGNYPENIR